MAIPDGYVALDFVGFTDQGTYDSTATYMTNDLVHDTYNNIWKCLQDNSSNVAPAAGDYWSLFMGASDSLTAMTATDTSGVLGSAGQVVVAQSLVDAIADKVMNDLVYKSQIINHLLATVAGNALDAVQGKELNDKIVSLNSDLAAWTYVAPTSTVSGCSMSPYKCGKVCQIRGTITATAGMKNYQDLEIGQLPEALYPVYDALGLMISGNRLAVVIVYSSGIVKLRPFINGDGFVEGSTIGFSILYPIK